MNRWKSSSSGSFEQTSEKTDMILMVHCLSKVERGVLVLKGVKVGGERGEGIYAGADLMLLMYNYVFLQTDPCGDTADSPVTR